MKLKIASLLVLFMLAIAPVFAQQPVAADYILGKKVTISVTADGTKPLSYQWSKDGAEISGATADSIVIAPAKATDAGVYVCRIWNPAGSVLSPTATLGVIVPPTTQGITIQVKVEEMPNP